MSAAFEIHDLGLQPYPVVHALQAQWLQARAQQQIPDRLILTEHEEVYTLGRKFQAQNLPAPGAVPVVPVERGGDITFHEPGQLVAYPIFWLPPARRDIRAFLRGLEQVLIEALAVLGFVAERDQRNTGVWLQGLKVASIGIGVRRWVSWHGLALNVNNDLQLSQAIQPCGLSPMLQTSLQRAAGQPLDMQQVKEVLSTCLQSWWGEGR